MTEDDSLQYAKENKKEIISSVIDGKEKRGKTAILWLEVLGLARLRLPKL